MEFVLYGMEEGNWCFQKVSQGHQQLLACNCFGVVKEQSRKEG